MSLILRGEKFFFEGGGEDWMEEGSFFFLRFFLEHLGFFWNWGSVFCWGSDGGGEFFFLEFFFWNNTLVFFLAGTKGGVLAKWFFLFFVAKVGDG